MDIIDKKSAVAHSFFSQLDESLDLVKNTLKNRTPHLNGKKFVTKKEVCEALSISERTLQEWRSSRVLPYIKLNGKILYRHSDIWRCLERHVVR